MTDMLIESSILEKGNLIFQPFSSKVTMFCTDEKLFIRLSVTITSTHRCTGKEDDNKILYLQQ